MEQIENKKSRPFKTLNEYLNLIILVPVLIGGIWQLINLSAMSMSYIRFFSLSQLIPDGLLILLYMGLILLPIILLLWMSYAYLKKSRNKNRQDNNHVIKKNSFAGFMSLSVSVMFLFYLWYEITAKNYYDIIECILMLIVILGISLLGFLLWFTALFLFGVSSDADSYKSPVNIMMLMYPAAVVILLIYFCYNVAIAFNHKYTVPEDLQNLERLIDPKKEELIYYNDTYIFIKDLDTINGKTKTRVVKFDKLFEE